MVFNQSIYHNTVSQWLMAAAVAVGVFVFIRIARSLLIRKLARTAPQTETEWDDLILELAGRINGLFMIVLAMVAGAAILSLPEDTRGMLSRIFFAVVLFQTALLGSHVISFFISRYRRLKIDSNAAAVTTLSSVGFVLKAMLWFMLLLVALDNFGINVNALVAGLGISGIAVALAVQNLLGDLFASFSIVFDKPFVIGDFIIVGDHLGTVEYVGLKTTRIRSLSGEQLIFSNGDLLKSRIRNFKRMYERRVVFSVGVVYQTPIEKLEAIPGMIRTIIERHNPVRFDRAHFKEYGAYSLNFEIVYWIQNPDYNVYMDIQQSINLSIYRQFQENGIEFAYPTRTLYIEGGHSGQAASPAASLHASH